MNNYTPNRRRDKGVEVVYDSPCVVYFLRNKVPAGRREPRRNQKEIKLKKYTKGNIMRLNKYIAQAGICSRRKADQLIANGNVKINGKSVVSRGGRRLGNRDFFIDDFPSRVSQGFKRSRTPNGEDVLLSVSFEGVVSVGTGMRRQNGRP